MPATLAMHAGVHTHELAVFECEVLTGT
jgi:hypothetical protein